MSLAQHAAIALVVAVAVVVAVRFEVFCIRDILHTPDSRLRYLTRAGWIAVCLVSIPVGGLVYLYCGKR